MCGRDHQVLLLYFSLLRTRSPNQARYSFHSLRIRSFLKHKHFICDWAIVGRCYDWVHHETFCPRKAIFICEGMWTTRRPVPSAFVPKSNHSRHFTVLKLHSYWFANQKPEAPSEGRLNWSIWSITNKSPSEMQGSDCFCEGHWHQTESLCFYDSRGQPPTEHQREICAGEQRSSW